ncbi:MAG TPA: ATP-binding protein [Chthoniobacterales bacterium]|jgi:PAS domain S-box-containing protein|nr:ATP-binding protein [Chthoniobacterales bacterium]
MFNLRDRPIRQKIMFVIMLISGAVLLLAFAALFYFQAYTLRQQSAHELAVVGEITAHNCAAAVMFKDEDAAAEILSGLKTMPQIVSARLELMDRQRLAFFGGTRDENDIKSAPTAAGFQIDGNRILLGQPVLLNGKREGTLYLLADLHAMTSQLLRLFGGIFALVLVASLLCAFVLSSQFQHFITEPILRLAGTARTVADHQDYSVRAVKACGDEVGVLTDAFNQMLAQIQGQEAAHARLTAILEATPDIVISAYPDGTAFYLNHASRQLLGLTEGNDVSNLKTLDFHPAWARKTITNVGLPAALENGSWAGETAILDRHGREIHVSQVLIAHKNAEGGVEYLSSVMRDMTERRQAEAALHASQQKLLDASRLAGMAEVATGVLHNVGNVLNSVNVSANLVVEKLRRSKAPRLAQAAALLTGRNGDLANYLANDPSGQMLPGYLAKLGEYFVTENAELLQEADQLGRNIEHIKEVVAMQQSYAKVSGVFENLLPERLVEDAIAMNSSALERHGIVLDRQFSPVPLTRVDRHKVLQILINLLRNAKYALDALHRTDKRITVSIRPGDKQTTQIVVADNGIGISAENLTRIFAHGFTTREDGHGFGLHSGALAAHAMGGSLSAASAGLGQGATFTLTLPLAAATSQT